MISQEVDGQVQVQTIPQVFICINYSSGQSHIRPEGYA